MPQVVMRFLEIMQDPNFKYDDLVKVLSADAGTVSEVLRLVNSALFGVREKIVSLRQALTLLGPKRTRSLLLGRYLVGSMANKSVPGLDMAYFWRRSLASSVIASRFADITQARQRDEIFIAALLADIGIPILAEAMPGRYAAIAERFAPLGKPFTADEEIEAVEVSHAQVSAMVLKHWTLPDSVTRAVNLHQSSQPGTGDAVAAARILNSADRIAKLLCEVGDPQEVSHVCIEAMGFVGIDMAALLKLLPSIERDIEELAEVLRIDVIPSSVYALIAKTIQEHLSLTAVGL